MPVVEAIKVAGVRRVATAQERAQNIYDRMVEAWNSKTGDDYRVQVGPANNRRTIIFWRLPELVISPAHIEQRRNPETGQFEPVEIPDRIVGVECWVRVLDRNGVELHVDGHRRLINPPLIPRSALTYDPEGKRIIPETITAAMVREALVEAVVDSLLTVPNPNGWVPA